MKYGFEKEYFVFKDGQFVLAPINMSGDECGYLVEARGREDNSPVMAAYKLLAVEHELMKQARGLGFKLSDSPYAQLPKNTLREANRRFGKNPYPATRGNLYGKDFSAHDKWQRAGLHVHFSDLQTIEHVCSADNCSKVFSYTATSQINMPKFIRALDVRFAKEIKEAKRIPGFYEMKPYGFEYRSLPANVDIKEVADFLTILV